MSLSAQPAMPEATIARRRVAPDRLLFVDNVRWVMILLVLSMHAAVTYSPFGGWYYREHAESGRATLLFFATYQSFLQGFFMALLFFVAGYFVPQSYDRKGAAAFLAGRLVRLGLPTILFVVLIGPVTEYFLAHSWHTKAPFAQALAVYFTRFRFLAGTGPLWFCVALLIFSIGYVVYRRLLPPSAKRGSGALPGAGGVVLTVAALAVTTFLIRIAMPVGTAFYQHAALLFRLLRHHVRARHRRRARRLAGAPLRPLCLAERRRLPGAGGAGLAAAPRLRRRPARPVGRL
jgi:fucose 4-O-acetylase-like acetyltransferase